MFGGFKTGTGRDVTVSKQSLSKAKQIMADDFNDDLPTYVLFLHQYYF